jgi:hypothetical protein
MRTFVVEHPGRYAATTGAVPTGPDDPLSVAANRVLGSLAAVLRGYPIAPEDFDHALRTLRSLIHGFATLQAGNGFQWNVDTDQSFEWLIEFTDRGLRALSS